MKEELESKKLSESEWAIMKIFWEKGSMALGDVVQLSVKIVGDLLSVRAFSLKRRRGFVAG